MAEQLEEAEVEAQACQGGRTSASHHLMAWTDMYLQQAVAGGDEVEREVQGVGALSAELEVPFEDAAGEAGPRTGIIGMKDRE